MRKLFVWMTLVGAIVWVGGTATGLVLSDVRLKEARAKGQEWQPRNKPESLSGLYLGFGGGRRRGSGRL